MSSLFQANLRGTQVGKDSPLELAFGSRVTLKNMGYGGGLLHSHVQTYPEGSSQQQVTCYHHKDANNEWFFYPNRADAEYDPAGDIRFIKNKDVIRLLHAQTGRNLHSHTIPAPVTKADYEVSGYGNVTVGDTKDHWVVEVVRDAASSDYSKIRTLTTAFRLRHIDLACYLRAGNVNLPQWGFKQIEVTCTKDNRPSDVYTHWNIESHTNERRTSVLAATSDIFRPLHLTRRILILVLSAAWRARVVQVTLLQRLYTSKRRNDDVEQRARAGPGQAGRSGVEAVGVAAAPCRAENVWMGRQEYVLRLSLAFKHIYYFKRASTNASANAAVKYFLLGNPAVYWGSTASLGVLALLVVFYAIRWQRGFDDLRPSDIDHIHYSAIYPLIGWFLHYLPFVAMARVTYVHHYFPALYFAILTLGFCVDWVTRPLASRLQWPLFGLLYTTVVLLFFLFRAVTFGMVGPASQWKHLKWFQTWRVTD